METRDIKALYLYLPIHRERFLYQNKQGETQDYQTTLIKTTQYFSQARARGEQWKVSHRIQDVNVSDTSHAIVSFEQIVYWSLWPGCETAI